LIFVAIVIGLGRAAARRGPVVIEFDSERDVFPPQVPRSDSAPKPAQFVASR